MRRPSIHRALPRATLALVLLALAGGGTAMADTSITEMGTRGVHRLDETVESGSAARCEYGEAAHRLDFVQVKRPLMRASNDHPGPGNDLQKVGWRARFQAFNGSTWQDIKVTSIHTTMVDDNAWATFPSYFRRWTADGPGYVVRAFVDMYWYDRADPNMQVGWSRHRVDFYRWHLEGSGTASRHHGSCTSILGP